MWGRLKKTALPVIAERRDGSFFILGKISEDSVLIQDPLESRPHSITRTEFEAQWSGQLILMTRRAGLGELIRRFDIAWFLQAMHKYRRLLGEVLVASFFLQLFALVSPLFFQVVIDKVLVHRGLTTLDVLVIGLVIVSVFESVLTALRTYVFSHTTNRIDVELGARLFRHLMALPIAYFEAAARRRQRGAGARTGEHPQLPDRLGADPGHRSVLHLRLSGRDGLLLAVPDRRRAGLVSVLYRDLGAGDAGVPPPARREVQPRRGEPVFPGRKHHRHRDAESDGGRAADAAPLGGTARRLCQGRASGCSMLGNWASQGVQLVSKLVTAAMLFFGAKAVIDGDLTVGELVAFNMLAGAGGAAGAAPRADVAGLPSGAALGRATGRHPQHPSGAELHAGPRGAAGDQGRCRASSMSASATSVDGPEVLHDITSAIAAGAGGRHRRPLGLGQIDADQAGAAALCAGKRRACWWTASISRWSMSSWLRRQVGVVLQENVLFNRTIRENIALADPGMPMERVIAGGQARRRA